MGDPAHDDKLARAAAALARAEGVARESSTRRRPPPPRDPAPLDSARIAPAADPESVARAIVLRQLALAPRSRAQLERKLAQRGCEPQVAARVLDRLAEVGLVDDEAYAELLVRSKHDTRGLARRGLVHELRKQGIDREVADEASGQIGDDAERAKAEELVAKRLRSMVRLPPGVQARRLAAMLARKGYPGGVAWSVVRAAVDDVPERERD